jgi:hypothetical protein
MRTTPAHLPRDFILPLGATEDGRVASLTGDDLLDHLVVFDERGGALRWENALLCEQSNAGGGWIAFDQWPSPVRPPYLAASLREAGRGGDFRILDHSRPDRSERWNPLRLGTAAEVAGKLMLLIPSGEIPAEQRAALRDMLAALARAWQAAPARPALSDVALLLRYANARAALEEQMSPGVERDAFARWCAEYQLRGAAWLKQAATRMADWIDAFVATDCGVLLDDAQASLDFVDIVASGQCLYLPVAISRSPAARTLAKLLMAELALVVARAKAAERPVLVSLSDVARAIPLDASLLASARRAGIGFFAALRADESPEGEDFISTLMREAGTKLICGDNFYVLNLVTEFLGKSPERTLVRRGRTMQLVMRAREESRSLPDLLPGRRAPAPLAEGERLLALAARAHEFVPKVRTRNAAAPLYAVRS